MLFTHTGTADQLPVLLTPGSLVVMQGEARYTWKHSIPTRKTDEYEGQVITHGRRVSLTYRNIIQSSAGTFLRDMRVESNQKRP